MAVLQKGPTKKYNTVISVSKKGNYGYFCCVHDSLEDLFYFVLHHAEKTPMVDSRCTFLLGWTYDIKAGILRVCP